MALDRLGLELQMVVSCPCGCWDVNLGPLLKQPVLFPVEPSLCPLYPLFLIIPEQHNDHFHHVSWYKAAEP